MLVESSDGSIQAFKGSFSSSMPCTWCFMVCLCRRHFHAQTDPLNVAEEGE